MYVFNPGFPPELQSWVLTCLFDISTWISSKHHKLNISLIKLLPLKPMPPAGFSILFDGDSIISAIQVKHVEVILDPSVFLTLLIQSVRKFSWF